MTIRQRLGWFKDYYLLKVLVLAACAAAAVFFLKTAMLPKSSPDAVILVIAPLKGDYTAVQGALSEKLGYEEGETAVLVEFMEEQTAFSGTMLGVKLAAGEYDAVIAERSRFRFFSDSGLLASLEELMGDAPDEIPEERLIRRGDLKTETEDKTGGSAIAGADLPGSEIAGISLKGNAFYASCTENMEDPVLGIIRSSDDMQEEEVILKAAI